MFNTFVWPACIQPDFDYPKVENLIIAGFGRNDSKNSEFKLLRHNASFNQLLSTAKKRSSWLLKAEVAEIPLNECRSLYNKTFLGKLNFLKIPKGITKDMLCAKNYTQHADTCEGKIKSELITES